MTAELEPRSKRVCDGSVVIWIPDWHCTVDEDYDTTLDTYNEGPFDWRDRAEPRFHAERTDLEGKSLNDDLLKIMVKGYTCPRCNEYIKSPMDVVVENMMRPSTLFEQLKKGRRS